MSVQVGMAEAQMLRAVQAVFRRGEGGASRLRVPRSEAPRRISPGAMQVLQSTLRKGTIAAMVRRGAWRERRAWFGGVRWATDAYGRCVPATRTTF